ncbi:MAG: hypothetical protein ACREJU_11350 [Nitrospiraceae bacterium]
MADIHDAGPYPFHVHGVNSAAGGPTREWIEVQLSSSLDASELLTMLDDSTVAGAWDDHGRIRLYWPRDCWNEEVLHRLTAPAFAGGGELKSDRRHEGWIALDIAYPAMEPSV